MQQVSKFKKSFYILFYFACSVTQKAEEQSSRPLYFMKFILSLFTSFSETIDYPSTWLLSPFALLQNAFKKVMVRRIKIIAKARGFSWAIFPCTRKPNRPFPFFSSNCTPQSLYILDEVVVHFTGQCDKDQVREPALWAPLWEAPVDFYPSKLLQDGSCRGLLQLLWLYLSAAFSHGGLIALCTRK